VDQGNQLATIHLMQSSSRDLAVYAVQQVQLPKGEEAWHVIIRMKLSLEYTEQIRACQYRQHQVGGATKR